MTAFGFDVSGCRRVRVVSYSVTANPTGQRTDISLCEVAAEYANGTVVYKTVPLEMNLAAFLAFIQKLNSMLASLNP